MILKQLEIGPMANFVYLVGCPDTREAAVVDPAWDADRILGAAGESGLTIRHILLTHAHPDHMNALEALLAATHACVYLHADEAGYLREVARSFGMPLGFLETANIRRVADGEKILVGRLFVEFLHTPGHTPGSQCFLIEGSLFTGDTLFVDACGRVDMPGGDPKQMWWSLNRRLSALDDSTVIYPGHDYGGSPTSTIGRQKVSNPYMNYPSAEQFVRDMQG